MLIVGIEARKVAPFKLTGALNAVIAEAAFKRIKRLLNFFLLFALLNGFCKIELLAKLRIKIGNRNAERTDMVFPVIISGKELHCDL